MKINKTMLMENRDEVVMPDISYEMAPNVRGEVVYRGSCIQVPIVLLEYLDKTELKMFCIIMRAHRETGRCTMRLDDMGKMMGVTKIFASVVLTRLQEMGIITLELGYGRRRNKKVNFDLVQKLSDYLQTMRQGSTVQLRKKMKERNIGTIPPSIDLWMRSNYGLSDDEVENEDYR